MHEIIMIFSPFSWSESADVMQLQVTRDAFSRYVALLKRALTETVRAEVGAAMRALIAETSGDPLQARHQGQSRAFRVWGPCVS